MSFASPPPPILVVSTSHLHLGTTRLDRLLRQVFNSKLEVLHYDGDRNGLSVWTWPLDHNGLRVPPENLENHCKSHEILRPYCLCLVNANYDSYPLASIHEATSGVHAGTLVSSCTVSEDSRLCCGYLAPLQRIYTQFTGGRHYKRAEPIQFRCLRGAQYSGSRRSVRRHTERLGIKNGRTRRAFSLISSPLATPLGSTTSSANSITSGASTSTFPVGSEASGFSGQGNRLKRSYAMLNVNDQHFTIPNFIPPARIATETEFLLKLDDYTQPGLYEEEFRALLSRMGKCTCGMIMVQRVFKEHRCKASLLRPIKRARFNEFTEGDMDSA